MARLRREHFIDLRPLTQSPAFARLWIGSTLAGLGGQLTIVAVMLHVFELTGSTLAVAMIAVAGLVPMILAGLYGGMLADYFDRRAVALIAASVTWVSTLLLAVLAWTGNETVAWLFLLSIVNSSANSIVSATKSAITPRLVPRELLPAAAALSGITVGIMVMAGPALAGVLVAFVGYPWTYTVDVVLMLTLFLGLWTLPRIRPEGATVRPGFRSLADGWAFLRQAPNIRLQYILDIIAMTFGHPLALFPAIGAVLLGGGAITTGVLTAAIAAGAFFSSLFSGPIGRVRRQGLGIERSILVFGAATAAFGGVLLVAAFGVFAPADLGEDVANLPLIVISMVLLAVDRRGRQRQRDLPSDDDAIRRARRDPRTAAGRLHGRRRRRPAPGRALRRHAGDRHGTVVPAAHRWVHHRDARRTARAAEPPVPGVRRTRPAALSRFTDHPTPGSCIVARRPIVGGFRTRHSLRLWTSDAGARVSR